jgi:hypothetical protein
LCDLEQIAVEPCFLYQEVTMAAGSDLVQPTDHIAAAAPTDGNAIGSAGAAMSNKDSQVAFNAMKPSENSATSLPDFAVMDGDSKSASKAAAAPSDSKSAAPATPGADLPDDNPYRNLTQQQRQDILDAAGKGLQNNDLAAEARAVHLPANAPEAQVDAELNKVADAMKPAPDPAEEAAALKAAAASLPPVLADMTTTDPQKAASAASHYFDAIFKDASPEELKGIKENFHNAYGNVEKEEEALSIMTPVSRTALKALGAVVDSKAP